jgi:hypothetical protein
MRKHPPIKLLPSILLIICASCSLFPGSSGPPAQTTPPADFVEPTPIPRSEVTITVTVPSGTPASSDLFVELLDEVTGWSYNTNLIPLTRLNDGRWQLNMTPPAGSLIRYRYLRQSPGPALEADIQGNAIPYRILHIPGSSQYDDIVAAWTDMPYQGSMGRIIGQIVDAETGQPLKEMITSVAGQTVFTDGQGGFRVDGLVPGQHRITVISPDGSYTTGQQGAIIAADSTTPAQMGLYPAKRIQVTFEVTVPEDTMERTPLRIAANLRQFGHLFTEAEGGMTNSIARMPTMIEVDPTHYIYIMDLYAGIDLRYKYTVGDGLWNGERDEDGNILTRQVILPDYDFVLKDYVVTWHKVDRESTYFWATVPTETPPDDQVSIQFNSGIWSSPIPMWRVGEREWLYVLFSPINDDDPVSYRYCRNQQCDSADDVDTPSSSPTGRQFIPGSMQQDMHDTIRGWMWWSGSDQNTTFTPLQAGFRAGFEVGFELLPEYDPTWDAYFEPGLQEIAETGANAVILTPSWVADSYSPFPALGYDPAYTPYKDHLRSIVRSAQQAGLAVILHPTVQFPQESAALWWQLAPRDSGWWTVWFEQYKSFILAYAQLAEETSVSKIVLGEPQIAPSLPDGLLADGSPSGVPALANSHWSSLISEMREIYNGRIAFEIELGGTLQTPPPFLDSVDEIHVYWHAPLSLEGPVGLAEMQAAARTQLVNGLLSNTALSGKSIVLSVEYPSVSGGTTACLVSEDGSCLAASAFDQGAFVNPDFQVNMEEQAQAINAMLTEASYQGAVTGFFVRRYNPIVALQDQSASINGKTAFEVLKMLYPQIRGQ